ncbi:insulinase family protein [Streptomyces sp. enrichment culture]|uniref:insulinase family protein n=1 Tax=Streptomyces sp. enrichment culture TaxID=1795815 RepID=UPI003F55BB9E
MTAHAFWVPGGFTAYRPGLAALALAVATSPLSGSPAGRAAAAGGALRAVLTPHGVQVHVWADDAALPESAWAVMDPVSDRAAQALNALRRSAARAELADPLERALHTVECAAWGRSRWSECWGADDDTYSGEEIDGVLAAWHSADRHPAPADHAYEPPKTPSRTWTAGPVAYAPGRQRPAGPTAATGGTTAVAVGAAGGAAGVGTGGTATSGTTPAAAATGRAELTLALPVAGPAAAGYAAVAAELLGRPYTGRLFASLRARRALAYGIAAVPLVRGGSVALVMTVSTTPDRLEDCARHMAATAREFTAAPLPASAAREAAAGLARARGAALARLRAAQAPTAQQRCVLEATVRGMPRAEDPAPPAGIPQGARPQWAVHGDVADRDRLERVLEGAW